MWFNLINFILQLAPTELALVKAIVDVVHNAHLTSAPLPAPLPIATSITDTHAASAPSQSATVAKNVLTK